MSAWKNLRTVLAAADADHVALLGISEGGPLSILFAATYPERVRSFVLYGTAARFTVQLPDFPWGFGPEWVEPTIAAVDDHWGEGTAADALFNEAADIPAVCEMLGRYERASANPAMGAMIFRAMTEVDVRQILHTVKTRALVLARPTDRMVPLEASQALAAALPNAEFRALSPGPHAALDSSLATERLEFVCGPAQSPSSERVLTTVLFTDIVGSTEQMSSQGDSRWRHQLDVHDQLADRTLSKYGGRRAKHTGDGIFALFDGPTKAARCALDLVPALASCGIRIRAGVHIGEPASAPWPDPARC